MPGTRTKKKSGGLGKTILKARNKKKDKVFSDRHQDPESLAHTATQDELPVIGSDELPIEEQILQEGNIMHNMMNKGRGKLESIIQTNDLQDLMLNAKLNQRRYDRESATFLIKNGEGAPKEYRVIDTSAREYGKLCCGFGPRNTSYYR